VVALLAVGDDVYIHATGLPAQVLDDGSTEDLVQASVARMADNNAANVLVMGDLHQGFGHVAALDPNWLGAQIFGETQILRERPFLLG